MPFVGAVLHQFRFFNAASRSDDGTFGALPGCAERDPRAPPGLLGHVPSTELGLGRGCRGALCSPGVGSPSWAACEVIVGRGGPFLAPSRSDFWVSSGEGAGFPGGASFSGCVGEGRLGLPEVTLRPVVRESWGWGGDTWGQLGAGREHRPWLPCRVCGRQTRGSLSRPRGPEVHVVTDCPHLTAQLPGPGSWARSFPPNRPVSASVLLAREAGARGLAADRPPRCLLRGSQGPLLLALAPAVSESSAGRRPRQCRLLRVRRLWGRCGPRAERSVDVGAALGEDLSPAVRPEPAPD